MSVYPSKSRLFATKIWENAFQTIPDVSFFDAEKKIGENFRSKKNSFSCFWLGFNGFRLTWTSPSASSSNFALDTLLISSVRPKIIENKTIIQLQLATASACAPGASHCQKQHRLAHPVQAIVENNNSLARAMLMKKTCSGTIIKICGVSIKFASGLRVVE